MVWVSTESVSKLWLRGWREAQGLWKMWLVVADGEGRGQEEDSGAGGRGGGWALGYVVAWGVQGRASGF